MNPIKVLIVDDHSIVRRGLCDLIATTDDIEVVGEAEDGAAAVTAVAKYRPEVVLMDISMPGMNGVDATRQVMANFPETYVVVLTSFGDQDTVTKALDAGAVGYLLKHAAPDDILAAIRIAPAGGSPLDPIAARALLAARANPTTHRVDLSGRELEVVRSLRRGLSNKQIARELGITERTVKAHLTNVYQRIGVSDRTQAALWAQEHLDT